jgi:hypothetical protein
LNQRAGSEGVFARFEKYAIAEPRTTVLFSDLLPPAIFDYLISAQPIPFARQN